MDIRSRAKRDTQRFSSDPQGHGTDITIIDPNNNSFVVHGLHTKHHLGVDMEGNMINSRKVHVSFAEKAATDLGCVIRDGKDEVNLRGFKFKAVDSRGVLCTYISQGWWPDEQLGYIMVICEDYE